MSADTIFRLYSMSKPITSVAAMMLVEDGKLALDDPVSKYIPAFADLKVGIDKTERNDQLITSATIDAGVLHLTRTERRRTHYAITGSAEETEAEEPEAEEPEAAERSDPVSALTCAGAEMFGPNRVTPASPRDSASRIQRGAERPGNGGMRMASASRARTGSACSESAVIPSPPRRPGPRAGGAGLAGRRPVPGS